MRISDWSSDVCSSDLLVAIAATTALRAALQARFDAHAEQYTPPGDRQNLFALAAGEAAGPLQAGLATAAALVLDPTTCTLATPLGAFPDSVDIAGAFRRKHDGRDDVCVVRDCSFLYVSPL